MQLSYKTLFRTRSGVEYLSIRNATENCLCLQGGRSCFARIRKAYHSAEVFSPLAPADFPAPLSLYKNQNTATALFENIDGGMLEDFLGCVSKAQQYAAGQRAGRLLHTMHEAELSAPELEHARRRQERFMYRLAEYLQSGRFDNDNFAIDALGQRHDHFNLWRAVMRTGSFRHDRIMVRPDGGIIFLPGENYGPGDLCEDFALLEIITAGEWPLFCAGAIDAYFSFRIPADFWLHFAMHCALQSLWRLSRMAGKDRRRFAMMQLQSDRVRKDFENFKKPIPAWYLADEVNATRKQVRARGM